MPVHFDEIKTTQAAVRFIAHEKGQMFHMKLMKLLYMLDRRSLIEYGRPVTFDTYYSMNKGPILSFTLDKIGDPPIPGEESYWHNFISEQKNYTVKLLDNSPEENHLSIAEEKLIDSIYEDFGHMDRFDLVRYTHDNFSEWKDPNGSSIPIHIKDILIAGGYSEEDADDVVDALEAEMRTKEMFR